MDAPPALLWVLDGIAPPAIIRNGRMDLLATNHLAGRCTPRCNDSQPGDAPNFARYTFLDDDSHRFYPDWDTARTPVWTSFAPKPAATRTTSHARLDRRIIHPQ